MSYFCLYSASVNADSVSENLTYTLNNVIFPLALNNTAEYTGYFNSYVNMSMKLDIDNQLLTINDCNLIFVYSALATDPSLFASTIARPMTDFLSVSFKFAATNNNTISFNTNVFSVVDNYQGFSRNNCVIRTTFLGGGYKDYHTKLSLVRSSGNLKNIDRVTLSSFKGVYSGNEQGLWNFLTYWDTNDNFISIGFCVYSVIQNANNFPLLNTSYASNINYLETFDNNIYPVKYNYRTYYFNALTNNQINQESYNIGYDLGLQQGEINGYENGYNIGEENGYTAGYSQGKIDGVASKGESVWVNSMSFIKNLFKDIFDILSIEILPNISIGTFIIIPLIFSVLFFVVKIAKGD